MLYPHQFVGFRNPHAPTALNKTTFKELWAAEPQALRETTYRRFRDLRDVNQWAALWWQIASGKFYPRKIDNAYYAVGMNTIDSICKTISSQSHDMICLNDPDWEIPFDVYAERIRSAFQSILPEKSSFEK